MNTTTSTSGPAAPERNDGAGPTATLISVLALALLVLGGLNWALVGLFRVDLVAAVFGVMSPLARLVYILVGLSALVVIGLVPRLMRGNDAPE
jgi:uncharacterized membrane protein YuzA (DUF378 family)